MGGKRADTIKHEGDSQAKKSKKQRHESVDRAVNTLKLKEKKEKKKVIQMKYN